MDDRDYLKLGVFLVIMILIYLLWASWYFAFPLVGIGIWLYMIDKKHKAEAKREAEEAKRQQHKEQQQWYLQQMVVLGEKSMAVFESMPEQLRTAEEHLNQAELDFSEGVFAPFWDSIENAARTLGRFYEGIQQVNQNSSHYTGLLKEYEADPPRFPLSPQAVAKLVVGTSTAERMKTIVRHAQSNFQFATIYEQRKTNQILVAGFANLAQALDEMTWRITASIDDLTSSVDAMGSTLNESMRAIHSLIGDIAESTARHHEDASVQASARVAREKKVVEMLDNIQRRRRPNP